MGNICTAALYKIRKVIYIHKIFTNRFAINEKAVYINCPIYTSAKRNSKKNVLRQIADSINAEGEMLYRSEWASGHSTHILASSFGGKKLLPGGYFFYETKKEMTTIFFSKNESPVVLATVNTHQQVKQQQLTVVQPNKLIRQAKTISMATKAA